MKTTCRVLLLAVLIFNVRLFADDAGQWKTEVTGLRIIAPPVEKSENARGAFFESPGVTVVVTLTPPSGGKVVSIDQFESKVDSFTDDKGTDLLAAKSEDEFHKPGFGMMDHKENFATAEIHVAGVPAKGATTLNISGKVSLKVAAATKEFTAESVDIKAGSSFKLGDMELKISKAGMAKAMFGDKEEFSVNLSSATDFDGIAKLEFFDAQGNKVEAHKSSWGGGMGAYFAEYTFKQSIDHAKIVATCFQDLKTMEVPMAIKTGVGL
jgi:hypothetical protein